MKVVVIGNGLLGKEIVRLSNWDCVSRSTHDFDFADVTTVYQHIKDYDIIINCIAHTDTYSDDKNLHWAINYKAVSRLTDWCSENGKKLVHISTDYVYANSTGLPTENDVPIHANNWYSYTKLLADGYIELKSNNYLLIRCGHKEFPFKYTGAWSDVKGNFDYVQRIADGIIRLVALQREGIYNVGSSDSHTMHDLAKESFPEVNEILSNDYTPKNVSMNCMKYKIAITDE
jgi:dTDP-4-dehydrorhamnose reductase